MFRVANQARDVHRRLQALSDTQLWVAVFFGRWLFVLAILLIFRVAKLGPPGYSPHLQTLFESPFLLVYVFLLAPVAETLFECSLPHLIMRSRLNTHPWIFVTTSAVLMVLIHPMGIALSTLPVLTGFTLAYCYLHFSQRHSPSFAFAATCTMHTAINLTGIALITLVRAAEGAA